MSQLQPAIVALLALVAGGLVWLAIEVRRLHADLEPLLSSSLARGISSF